MRHNDFSVHNLFVKTTFFQWLSKKLFLNLNRENLIFLLATVFIPSCRCWRPLVASASSRGPATARTTRARTATPSARRKTAGKTTPCECGGPDRWAPPRRRAEIKAPMQRRRRPEPPAGSTILWNRSRDVYFLEFR